MKHLTVKKLRDELDRLIERGMGDRAVAFPICEYDEGWDGDFVLVGHIATDDVLEVTVYLKPLDVDTDRAEWDVIEDASYRQPDEEEDE